MPEPEEAVRPGDPEWEPEDEKHKAVLEKDGVREPAIGPLVNHTVSEEADQPGERSPQSNN